MKPHLITVLAVDDDQALLRMLKIVLPSSDGFRVCTALDGRAALAELERCCPDLILLDLAMPVMDGEAFLSTIRDRRCDTPVLIMTASEPAVVRRLPAQGYLKKPFRTDELGERIKRVTAA